MIQRGTLDWKKFLKQVAKSKRKSNRDVLCTDCWEILTYERNLKHKADFPEHVKNIITSRGFATEGKFIKLAKALNKFIVKDDREYFENPYKHKELKKRLFKVLRVCEKE